MDNGQIAGHIIEFEIPNKIININDTTPLEAKAIEVNTNALIANNFKAFAG